MENNRIVFIKGKRIDLCVLYEERHLENCIHWINDKSISHFLYVGAYPLNWSQEKGWINSTKTTDRINLAIETKEGQHIGNIGFHEIDWRNRRTEMGIMIGDKSFWGQGYATEAEGLLVEHGFNIGFNRICALVYNGNHGSAKALQKNGFKLDGCLRQYVFKNGQYYDVNVFSLLFEEWKNNK